jgi:alcohol dehydrogenase class IV
MNEVTTIRALISYLHFLNAEMGIPAKISEACPKLTETEYMNALNDMAAAALVDGCTATNPRTPSKEEVIEIYKKIW